MTVQAVSRAPPKVAAAFFLPASPTMGELVGTEHSGSKHLYSTAPSADSCRLSTIIHGDRARPKFENQSDTYAKSRSYQGSNAVFAVCPIAPRSHDTSNANNASNGKRCHPKARGPSDAVALPTGSAETATGNMYVFESAAHW